MPPISSSTRPVAIVLSLPLTGHRHHTGGQVDIHPAAPGSTGPPLPRKGTLPPQGIWLTSIDGLSHLAIQWIMLFVMAQLRAARHGSRDHVRFGSLKKLRSWSATRSGLPVLSGAVCPMPGSSTRMTLGSTRCSASRVRDR
jgi:hypothetical protein